MTLAGDFAWLAVVGTFGVTVGGAPCTGATITAIDAPGALSCSAPPGVGTNVTVAISPSDPRLPPAVVAPHGVDFTPPRVDSAVPDAGLRPYAALLRIVGEFFGGPTIQGATPPVVTFGLRGGAGSIPAASIMTWSQNQIQLLTPAMYGADVPVRVAVSGQWAALPPTYVSFANASVTSITPAVVLPSDGRLAVNFTISGADMPVPGHLPNFIVRATVGGVACPRVTASDGASVACLDWVSPRAVNSTAVTVSVVAAATGEVVSSFTRDLLAPHPPPAVRALAAATLPTTGAVPVRLLGSSGCRRRHRCRRACATSQPDVGIVSRG